MDVFSGLTGKVVSTANHSGPRNHAIDTITPHYMCWYTDGETCAQSFVPSSRQASANYCIGKSGDIVGNVSEDCRAWTTGNAANDNRAVTIECANHMDSSAGHVWGQLPAATWDALVRLCADICKRNGKTRLVYRGKADYSGLSSTDMLLTKHKWFQDTDCPGPWLDGQFDELAKAVNARLAGIAKKRVYLRDVFARIHYDMVTYPGNGYSQGDRWGGQTGKTRTLRIEGREYTYAVGDYDCASSVITAARLALKGTKYEGKLDGATFTGDMERAFVNSGLFTSSKTTAKRGDIYLTPKTASRGGHTAACQDGGSDGVFGYDCLSEFNRNEHHTATGGQIGDQDGGESVFRKYYDYPWATVLHWKDGTAYYEVEAKVAAKQPSSKPKNSLGMKYRVHVQSGGWMPSVHDGQIAGTVGQSLRVEALKITPPEGVVLDVYAHVQGIGNLYYDNVRKGKYDPVMGTVGNSKRVEAIRIDVKKMPESLKDKALKVQAHVQGAGWTEPVPAGKWAGTRGKGKRIEALKIWFE